MGRTDVQSPVDLVTVDDLADMLGVRPGTVYWWRNRGLAPRAIKVGRRVFFRREDVERWLSDHEEQRV